MARQIPSRVLSSDNLRIEVFASREAMGQAAAEDVAVRMRQLLDSVGSVRIVFAAAPSQKEFLANLRADRCLDWSRVEAFHMDEYIGLTAEAPQGFGNFLRAGLFDRVRPGRVEYLDGQAPDPVAECARYASLLAERPIDIVCAGIGENGHLAFNDPAVAQFDDPEGVKVVTLDHMCRAQQVNDGAFAAIGDVPKSAMTLTIPALMAARWLYCVVPGPTKTAAVRRTVQEPISTACPAGIMRRHERAVLYLDVDAASGI